MTRDSRLVDRTFVCIRGVCYSYVCRTCRLLGDLRLARQGGAVDSCITVHVSVELDAVCPYVS